VGGLARATEPPTVTFTSSGLVPVACGSSPDVSTLSVVEGTPIVVVNHSGVSGRVEVGGAAVLTLADGEAGTLTLTLGSHNVVLVPQCVLVVSVTALVVTVTKSPQPDPTQPSTPSGSPTEETLPPTSGPEFSNDPTATADPTIGPRPKRMPAGVPVAGEDQVMSAAITSASATSASPTSASSPPAPSGVVQAEAIPWTKPEDSKGVRLLAVIAVICVLGVTAAIIRSIVRLDA
jgi:hypothetical protein